MRAKVQGLYSPQQRDHRFKKLLHFTSFPLAALRGCQCSRCFLHQCEKKMCTLSGARAAWLCTLFFFVQLMLRSQGSRILSGTLITEGGMTAGWATDPFINTKDISQKIAGGIVGSQQWCDVAQYTYLRWCHCYGLVFIEGRGIKVLKIVTK